MNFRIIGTGIALSLVLCAGQGIAATTTAATPQNPQGESAQRPDNLNLTEDQKAQLKAIRQRTREQMQTLRNDQTLAPEQRQAKARSIREATHQEARGVLTPQQQELARNNRMERHGRGLDHGRGFDRGPGRGPAGSAELNLTADQRTQLKSIHENTRSQVGAIRNDSTLTPEQRQEKIRGLHQNTRQQLSTILTPEQQQKMKESRRGGRHGGRHDGPGRFGGPRGRRDGFPGTTPPQDKPSAKPSDKP